MGRALWSDTAGIRPMRLEGRKRRAEPTGIHGSGYGISAASVDLALVACMLWIFLSSLTRQRIFGIESGHSGLRGFRSEPRCKA